MKRSRMDLEAVTIERGRDAGVASYNSVRRRFDLPTVDDFEEFTGLSDEVSILLSKAKILVIPLRV